MFVLVCKCTFWHHGCDSPLNFGSAWLLFEALVYHVLTARTTLTSDNQSFPLPRASLSGHPMQNNDEVMRAPAAMGGHASRAAAPERAVGFMGSPACTVLGDPISTTM